MGLLRMSPYVYAGVVYIDRPAKSVEKISKVCCDYFKEGYDIDMTGSEKKSKRRTRKLVDARRVMAYVLRSTTNMTLMQIGKKLGVHHSSIIHYTKTFVDLHDTNSEFRDMYEGLCSKLAQNNLL